MSPNFNLPPGTSWRDIEQFAGNERSERSELEQLDEDDLSDDIQICPKCAGEDEHCPRCRGTGVI